MSSFTWLDYAENDRQRMLDVVRLFKEPGTLDEMGIGTVRDAWADRFFPGTSTIQTRARYFLFIPWIYQALEARKTPSSQIGTRARQQEFRLIKALNKSHPGERGIIGSQAGADLKRLPSDIYWRGLEVWGLRLFSGPQAHYKRSLDHFYVTNGRHNRFQSERDDNDATPQNWHPGLPPAPAGFPDEATLDLTAEESHYLRERLITRAPESLLAHLVEYGRPGDQTDFPWQHPLYVNFPPDRQGELAHARNFSEVINGAALLYNYLLSEQWARLGNGTERQDAYAERLALWEQSLNERQDILARWDWQDQFWHLVYEFNPRITYQTQLFIKAWLALALAREDGRPIQENPRARDLVAGRETRLKGRLSRLHNARALEMWNGDAGTAALDYRWRVVQTLLDDILRGFEQKDNHAGA